jgi:transcriptional regulator with XRE-family HTH domain
MEKMREVDPRRAELGDFLRRRRAALTPESAGLPAGARRRTPGLRREEVAELAEISVALYTWLEQGRDVPVSRRTIDAIADALRLSPGEHRHLHYLALQEEVTLREEITPSFRRMVSTMRYPVFVLDHNWDIVLTNAASDAVFGSRDGDGDATANLLETVFLDDDVRALFPDYPYVVSSLLAMFRLEFPAHADDPRSIELVARLRSESPLFNELWERYDVKEHPSGVRRIVHPLAGELSFEPALLGVVESPGLRMMVYTPADETTAERVERLVADHVSNARNSVAASI